MPTAEEMINNCAANGCFSGTASATPMNITDVPLIGGVYKQIGDQIGMITGAFQDVKTNFYTGAELTPKEQQDAFVFNLTAGVGGLTSLMRGAAVTDASTFFEGATLHQRVLKQLESGDNHAFPTYIDELAKRYGTYTQTVDRRGGAVEMLTLRGSRNGESGTYEYIKNQANEIYHRFFKQDHQ